MFFFFFFICIILVVLNGETWIWRQYESDFCKHNLFIKCIIWLIITLTHIVHAFTFKQVRFTHTHKQEYIISKHMECLI